MLKKYWQNLIVSSRRIKNPKTGKYGNSTRNKTKEKLRAMGIIEDFDNRGFDEHHAHLPTLYSDIIL